MLDDKQHDDMKPDEGPDCGGGLAQWDTYTPPGPISNSGYPDSSKPGGGGMSPRRIFILAAAVATMCLAAAPAASAAGSWSKPDQRIARKVAAQQTAPHSHTAPVAIPLTTHDAAWYDGQNWAKYVCSYNLHPFCWGVSNGTLVYLYNPNATTGTTEWVTYTAVCSNFGQGNVTDIVNANFGPNSNSGYATPVFWQVYFYQNGCNFGAT